MIKLAAGQDYHPAHGDIKEGVADYVLALVEDIIENPKYRQGPDDAEHDPAFSSADGDQGVRSVRAGNSNKDRRVVEDLEDLVCLGKDQAVVEGREEVKQDHAGPVDGECSHSEGAMGVGGPDY